eukprot:TRINITY_DN3611_c0_g1_i1.p1 TRINITY_DN3611_c0_g1~~TRINITY_DN3611_c0_g1_i1.p1  ORF type:complete len:599 (+),score=222.43 TRINITY_DN3611_c0_g1_i1:42-1838(+)
MWCGRGAGGAARRISTAAGLHGSQNLPGCGGERGAFYLTTAINYTNGPPHCGHAYEAVLADACARHHRLAGKDVYFLTGSDEHGQKIANRAAAAGVAPAAYCAQWVEKFQALNARLLVSHDRYIRTSEDGHKATCQELWRRCEAGGDIYFGQYEGWYNEREELFVPEAEAERDGYCDADGVPLKRVSEPCYFFRLSKYHDRLKKFLAEADGAIYPEACRTQALDLLKTPLRDLCISRTAFTWGVPTPEGTEPGHVMYVWFDALANYLSAAASALSPPGQARGPSWPADVHVVGKDIIRFHCVFWPAMLWSAGLEAPKRVWAHGFVNDPAGRKMSKSLGNVTCPEEVLTRFPADSVRFFLCSEAGCGGDLKFGEDGLRAAHNTVLADTVGNLLQRMAVLTTKFCDGAIPDPRAAADAGAAGTFPYPYPPPFDLETVRAKVIGAFDECDVRAALQQVLDAFRETNKWLTDREPWKDARGSPVQLAVLRHLAEACYALAHFLAPFLPATASAVFAKLRTPGGGYHDLSPGFDVLATGTAIDAGAWATGGKTLFPKFEEAAAPAGGKGHGKWEKKEKNEKKEKKKKKKAKQRTDPKPSAAAA